MNTDPFMNWTTLNGNSVIGVNLENWKGATINEIAFVITVPYINKNLLSSLVFMFETVIISAQKASIDECLSIFGKSKNIGDEMNVQNHTSVET